FSGHHRHGLYRRWLPLSRSFATKSKIEKPSKYGQPFFQSHPHLVQPNEVTAGIPAEDYECRRRSLMEALPDDSVVISVSAPIKYMSNSHYKYRQASDFWYLTGFMEPDSAVILEKTPSLPRGYRMTLFCPGKDAEKEKWDGPRTSLEDAASIFRADYARLITSFSSHLRSTLPNFSNIFVDTPESHRRGQATRRSSRATSKSILKYLLSTQDLHESDYDHILSNITSCKCKSLSNEVARLRIIKSPAERGVMRAAACISGRAHAKTMGFTRPGLSEAALAAHFEYACTLSGAQRLAYVPVVASGGNALVIHYTQNNHLLRPNEIVLMDAGCEYNGYASDITRSFPVSGVFTEPQRDLYSAVLSVQKSLINLCTEQANMSMYDLHRLSCDRLRQELAQVGFNSLRTGDLERILYPHFLSHSIGIDLHETSNFDRGARLQSGMVLTIEPGIYVPPLPDFPKHFHNIGIRIEDEVLVGKDYPTVLTDAAPKEISDIEGACQRPLLGLE
ncbi:peptidase M24, structural domain-containing protein, partial [Amanita rubescens]